MASAPVLATVDGGRSSRGRQAGDQESAPADSPLGRAQAALVEGDVQDALSRLERLRVERPASAEVRLWLGHAYRRGGDLSAATREYLEAAGLDPADAEVHVALGEVQEEAGNFEAAIQSYRRALELDPDLINAYRKLASVQMKGHRYGDAIPNLRAYLDRQPDDPVAVYLHGYALFMHQEHDAAIEAFERALELDPDSLQAHHGLGVVLARRPGREDRALEHLRAALPMDGGNATAHYLIGRILADRGELDEAREALQQSVELDPSKAEAHYQLAQVLAQQGDREAARRVQERFQELQGDDKGAEVDERRLKSLKNSVSAALGDNDLELASRRLRELLDVAPADVDAWNLAAKVRFSRGEMSEALEAIRQALEADPDHWEALYLQGLSLYRLGRLEEARAALEASLQSHPLFADSHTMLGNVLLSMDRPGAAVDSYRRAIAIAPDNATYYLNLAMAYRRLGREADEAEAMAGYREHLDPPGTSAGQPEGR